MGEIVGAAVVSHVPPIVLPEGVRRELNDGEEISLVPGLHRLRSECLDRLIFFGDRSLRNACREYLSHYHGERNHQGLGNRLIEPSGGTGTEPGPIECRERLGGMLRYYYREAA